MGRIRSWIKDKSDHPILKNILILVTGTTLSQAVAVLISVFTARLFSPDVFGQMAIYGAITSVIAAIAALRYDMTVVLPESDDEARVIGRLATRSVVTVSILTTVLAFALKGVIIDVWGDEELARWMPFAGLTVFLLAQVTLLQYWYNRKRSYKIIARNHVQQTVGSSGGQLVFGLAGVRSMLGLLFGVMAGYLFAFFWMNSKAKEFRQAPGPGAPTMRYVAAKHKKMPLLNLPNALVDAVRTNGIVMIIGTFALGLVGQFNLAWRVLQVPIGLINGAVQQVFFRELADVKPGRMRPLIRSTIRKALVLSAIPFGLIYIISPWLFTFVFGPQWDLAGDIARALTPWLALQMVTSPISTVFVVTSKQHWMLAFAVVFAAAPLAWLALSPLAFIDTLTVLGLLMAGMLAVNLLLADLAAADFDSKEVEA
ncbi:teichoic acid transporter [Trueperella bernardiae]|uniref:lipopolysaccharide biosynthesis protein n=1 Tax=Trueperella bernardiae TaxID=59561 RepID=UPI000839716C|nr:oligosaccharide flippase family protein [Trueperella bernardiae]OCW60437.1 hypothetical protein AKG36_04705 [Trueperella bernardiae]PKZ88875.1 teichoic acid transporter [Trueperella bernardiae]